MNAGSKLRVLVLEDEWVARNYLVELISSSDVAEVIGAVESLEAANDFVASATRGDGLDVVFVDIHLVGSADTGLALVRQWSMKAGAPRFVLATARKDHAVEAYELGVVDYVLKPFVRERVQRCLERLSASSPPAEAEPPRRIVARSKRNLVFLDVDDVWAFEAKDRLTQVHCARGCFDVDLSLHSVEMSLGRVFLRVHRNWLVHREHVRELERETGESALWVGSEDRTLGVRVPVARDRTATLRTELLENALGMRKR